eukprot:3774128-Pyramimonas_sp.AAC.1
MPSTRSKRATGGRQDGPVCLEAIRAATRSAREAPQAPRENSDDQRAELTFASSVRIFSKRTKSS